MSFKLPQIEAFIEVAKHKSFTIAASNLYVTQPRISGRIKQLEETVGFRLFNRTSKSVTLTENGELLFRHLSPIIHLLDSAQSAISQINQVGGQIVRVGAIPLHTHRRWKVLEAFLNRYPESQLNIEVGWSTALSDRLVNGDLDLAFIHRRRNSELEYLPMRQEKYGLICRIDDVPECRVTELSQLKGRHIGFFRRDLAPILHDKVMRILSDYDVEVEDVPEVTDEGILNFVRFMGIPVLWHRPWDDEIPTDLTFEKIRDMPLEVDFGLARAGPISYAADRFWLYYSQHLETG